MTKYILVGGYIHKAVDGGKAFCDELVKSITHKPIKILDCMFARPEDVWQETFTKDQGFFSKYLETFELELAQQDKFVEQVKNADAIFFRGGVSSKLTSILRTCIGWEKELSGKVVAGTSAGADALCTYYGVGETMRIGSGLGLLPYKCIPHWKSADYGDGKTINWDLLLENLKSHEEDLEILTLPEAEFVVIEK